MIKLNSIKMGKKWDGSDFNCRMAAGARPAGLRVSENVVLPGFKHATTLEATRNNGKLCSTYLSENVLSLPEFVG